jgi:hypothetical protein
MPDDLLLVILCELGERMLAMREALSEPSVATKPHARAVAALLNQGLDALEARLQRDVLAAEGGTREATPALLDTLYQCGQALRALHARLGLLDMRWSAASVDIFLRKLRDDVGAGLPHPAVVLSDDYAALDDDVADSLSAALEASGVAVDPVGGMEPTVALPRIESVDPLCWPLLLPALGRIYLAGHDESLREERLPTQRLRHKGARSPTEDPTMRALVAVRLIGPAAFAARTAQGLLFTPVDASACTFGFWSVQHAAAAVAGGLENNNQSAGSFDDSGIVGLFTRLLGARDEALNRDKSHGWAVSTSDAISRLPEPDVPTVEETAALLDKLVAGTPINAIDPPVPADFLARLEGVDTPDAFYALIGPLGERPASLAAILGVGWLYKVRYSYPLFGRLLAEHGAMGRALAAYRPHALERGNLLAQSIEAAHVQGIFVRGKAAE